MTTEMIYLSLFFLFSLGLYLCLMPLSFRAAARQGPHRLIEHCTTCTGEAQKEPESVLRG